MSDQAPFVDEHATVIRAGVIDVWLVLGETVERATAGTGPMRYARMVRCTDQRASGPRPLDEGSTMPGFHVVAAVPGAELALEGSHRFSSYALTFRLEALAVGRSRLAAETRAAFPGWTGAAYRLLVIGTGAHALLVRRLLSGIKHRAELRPRHQEHD